MHPQVGWVPLWFGGASANGFRLGCTFEGLSPCRTWLSGENNRETPEGTEGHSSGHFWRPFFESEIPSPLSAITLDHVNSLPELNSPAQAQSKEKTLAKMVRGGLTDKVAEEKNLSFYFPDPGKLNGSILQFQVFFSDLLENGPDPTTNHILEWQSARAWTSAGPDVCCTLIHKHGVYATRLSCAGRSRLQDQKRAVICQSREV